MAESGCLLRGQHEAQSGGAFRETNTTQELEAFRGAKAIEVKNFVASKAFETLPDHLKPDKRRAIGMRWILT